MDSNEGDFCDKSLVSSSSQPSLKWLAGWLCSNESVTRSNDGDDASVSC